MKIIESEINYGRKAEGIGWQCGREEPRKEHCHQVGAGLLLRVTL